MVLAVNDQPSDNNFEPLDSATLALDLLADEVVIANTFATDFAANFAGHRGASVDVKLPTALFARSRGIDDTTNQIVIDSMGQATRSVTLDTLVYNAVGLSVKDWSLDLENFGTQVLFPQVEAVARDIEERAVAAVKAIPALNPATAGTPTYDPAQPQKLFTKLRKKLRDAGLPMTGLVALVGTRVYADLVDAKAIEDSSQSGTNAGLRDASAGRVKGFNIVEAVELDEDEVAVYHNDTFQLVVRAPEAPRGASFAESVSGKGFALLHDMGFDTRYRQDVSVVSTIVGVIQLPMFRKATVAEHTASAPGGATPNAEIYATGVIEVGTTAYRVADVDALIDTNADGDPGA
jgi:hypothetical protein